MSKFVDSRRNIWYNGIIENNRRNNMTLTEKLHSIDLPKLKTIVTGKDDTIRDFWDSFILPLLPDKTATIGIYKMLLKYIDDPEAVFAVRNYSQPEGGRKNYVSLRRGFFTQTDKYSYFFTDNFYAAYFCKMALDGYVPNYNEFKEAMISRSFPARFGPFDSKFERVKAAYSIDGNKGKDPGFGKAGYKISHIVDSGKGYLINGKEKSIADWSSLYGFTRGDYNDYALQSDKYGNYYARKMAGVPSDPLDVLKAHFLRLACPLNYILTPKAGKNRCHSLGVVVKGRDVGEMPELQQYAMEQFKMIYGPDYDDYLSRLMLTPSVSISDPGSTYIGISYGIGVGSGVTATKAKKAAKAKQPSAGKISGVGQYCKKVFSDLLNNNKLTQKQIVDLRDKDYCSKNLGISFPIVVEIGVDSFDPRRYYKDYVNGKYVICSQWYSRHKDRVDSWLASNGL